MKTCLKITISIIALYFSGVIQANNYQLSSTDKEYLKIVRQYEAKCAEIDTSRIPITLNDMFCSSNPKNKIAATFCLLRNLEMSGNNDSIKFGPTSMTEANKNKLTTITITIPCDGFNITKA